MKNIAVKLAIYAFVITVVWTLIEHTLGYNTSNHEVGQYTRILTALLYYYFIARAIWLKRKQQNGSLTFSQGFKTGATISILYGSLVTFWFAFYAEVINPQYQPTLLAFERSKLEAVHASPETIAIKMKQLEMSSGGSITSYLLLFAFMTIFGLVITLVATAILRRKNIAGEIKKVG